MWGGIEQTGYSNTASITQSVGGVATTDQSGSFNESLTVQNGNAIANVDQGGNSNRSYVDQNSDADAIEEQLANVTQAGSNNFADVEQYGAGPNTATINQYTDFGEAMINQHGADNSATITQGSTPTS